jgi:hypothetical protein
MLASAIKANADTILRRAASLEASAEPEPLTTHNLIKLATRLAWPQPELDFEK